MSKIKDRILSLILSLGILLSMVNVTVRAEMNLFEDFESYSDVSEIKGNGKLISSVSNANLALCTEESVGNKNQYLEVSGSGVVSAVTNPILPNGISNISMQIKFLNINQQVILRASKEVMYLLNVDGANRIRLLNDTTTTISLDTQAWYEFSMIVDTDKKTISAKITNSLTGETVSNVKTYTGDAANQIVKDAHLRVKVSDGITYIDNILCRIPSLVSFEQEGRMLSVFPELTFKSDCNVPLEAENILINGESGFVSEVIDEGKGIYKAILSHPLEKNSTYFVSLKDYKDSDGFEAQFTEAEFYTRDSGLTMTKNNDTYVIKNELSDEESAVVAGMSYDGDAIKDWDFERITLGGGESFDFSMPSADCVVMMNNLNERIPYEVYSNLEQYDTPENEDLLNVNYNEHNYMLTCTGTSPEGAGRQIIATIISESLENTDFDTASKEEVKKAMPFICGFITNSEGVYGFKTKSNFKTEKYKVYVNGVVDSEKIKSDNLLLLNPKDAEYVCDVINGAKNVEAVENALIDYAYVLDTDYVLLNNMTDKSFVYQYVFEQKEKKEYTSAAEISADMKAAATLVTINKSNTDEICKIIDEYAEELGFKGLNTYQLWKELKENEKTYIIEKVHDREYTSVEQFLERLQKHTIYATIKAADDFLQVQEAIENNYELLGISLNKYNSLNAQKYVSRQMMNKEYNEDNFALAFNGYVEEFERLKKDGEITDYTVLNEDFEKYSKVSELKGDGKIISNNTNSNLDLRVEDNLGKNKYLEISGAGTVQAVTNPILPEGVSQLSTRIKLSAANQQLVLRASKEIMYLLNVDTGNRVRLLNDSTTALALDGDAWYEFTMIADTDKKTISAKITNSLTGETVSNTKTYTGDAADQIVKDAHLRVKVNDNTACIDDIIIKISASASLEQAGRILSVLPEITFVTNCDMPLKKENILINGESGYIGKVVEEKMGKYRAFFSKPLEKGKKYIVSLSGYKNSEDLETQMPLSEFSTRNSGLTLTKEDDIYVVKNELSDSETAVIAGVFINGDILNEWDFEKLTLNAGEKYEFSMPAANNVILMNNLSERIPYEIYTKLDKSYEDTQSDKLLEFTYDNKNFILKCAGESPEGANRQIIVGVVSDADKSIDLNAASKEEVKNVMPFICGFITDSEGKYSFKTETTFNTERYRIKVSGVSESERTESDSLLFINKQDAEQLCSAVNAAKDTEGVKNALTEYAYVIDSDFELLNNMTDKSFIYKCVFERKNKNAYISASDISEDMKAAAVLYAINKANAEEAYKLIDEYAKELGFDTLETYSLWTTLNDVNKVAVIEKIHNAEYTSVESFLDKLQKYTAYMVIKTTERYYQVQEIIENNYRLLGISIDKYKKIEAQTYVAKKMINKDYNESNFTTEFNKYVDEYEVQINNSRNTSHSSGGNSIYSPGVPIQQKPKPTLEPVKPSETVKGLNDIDTVPWAKESIIELYNKGIISGYDDGGFRPNQAITREEFVKLLGASMGIVDNNASCNFDDVPNDAWYKTYVASAKQRGIIEGISDTKFGTGANLSRQDMCTMIFRAINTLGIGLYKGEPIAFSDADNIASYANEAVNALSAAKIINGMGDKFEPTEFCTRAQVAKVLYELYSISDIEDDSSSSAKTVEVPVSDAEKGLLNAMGMLNSEDNEDRIVTRGEFAGELVKLIGMEKIANAIEDVNSYSDVDKFTENGRAIEYLKEQNIMAGYENNSFGPNDAMNSHIAVATVGKALGYAENLSDSNEIYSKVISYGISPIKDKDITYSELVHLFYEALYCKVYKNTDGKLETQLESVFDIYDGVGIITATEITSLDGQAMALKGQICIDNQPYTSEGYSQYLGYRVKYYYSQDTSGERKLVYAYPSGVKILDINAEDIDNFTARRLSYTENGKTTKNARIPLSADVIYNGKAFPNYNNEIFKPKAGNIRLIDTGNGYNTVFINEYTSGVLTKISKEKNKLYFEGGGTLAIDNIDYLFIENSEQKAITVDDLKIGSVISYMQSKDGMVVKLIMSDKSLEGEIETLKAENMKVSINGVEYYISPDFKPNTNALIVGTPLYMYLDYRDLIVMADPGENQRVKMGYLIKTYNDEVDNTYVRLLTSNNELVYLQCKDKVTINNKSVSNNNVKSELSAGNDNESQLIRYRVDDKGNLSWIETAVNRNDYSGMISDTENIERLYIDVKPDAAIMYKAGINTFSGKCMLDDSTEVFCVQTDTSVIDKQNFRSGNLGLLSGDKKYNFIAYRTGSLGTSVAAVVIFDDDNTDPITPSTPVCVVKDIRTGVNADGDIVQYYSIIKQNKELTYEVGENVSVIDAQGKSSYTENGKNINYVPDLGDIIRFASNSEGKIVQIQILVDRNRDVLTSASNPNDNDYGGSQFHYIYSKVYDYSDNVLTLCKNKDFNDVQKLDMEMYRQIESIPIIVCENINGKVIARTGTVDDIETYRQVGSECSSAFISCRYGTPQSVVIYNNVMN